MNVTRLSISRTPAREAQSAQNRPASGETRSPAAFRNALAGARSTDATTPKAAASVTQVATSVAQSSVAAVSTVSTPSIAAMGTPNGQVQRGQLLELGGGVYYNTAEGNYQDLTASVVGTNRHAVQQYTDPVGYFYSGAAFEPSDDYLRETIPNLDELVPPGEVSPTVLLNGRWAFQQVNGAPPVDVTGNPSFPVQSGPIALMAYPGVLKAPGPPPQEGTFPPWNYSLSTPADATVAAVQAPQTSAGSGVERAVGQHATSRQTTVRA